MFRPNWTLSGNTEYGKVGRETKSPIKLKKKIVVTNGLHRDTLFITTWGRFNILAPELFF